LTVPPLVQVVFAGTVPLMIQLAASAVPVFVSVTL